MLIAAAAGRCWPGRVDRASAAMGPAERGGGARWNGSDAGDSNGPARRPRYVDRFVAPGAGPALAQAHNAVTAGPGGTGDEREDATFRRRFVDQLAKAGYDTINPDPHGGLVTEVHQGRDVVVPKKPRTARSAVR